MQPLVYLSFQHVDTHRPIYLVPHLPTCPSSPHLLVVVTFPIASFFSFLNLPSHPLSYYNKLLSLFFTIFFSCSVCLPFSLFLSFLSHFSYSLLLFSLFFFLNLLSHLLSYYNTLFFIFYSLPLFFPTSFFLPHFLFSSSSLFSFPFHPLISRV